MVPLIPVISALAAGGTLVPHAAGGLIVTGGSGYVSGTFVSTSAVAWLLGTTGVATAGLGLVATSWASIAKGVVGVAYAEASSIAVSQGVTSAAVGATGFAGKLKAACLLCAKPVALVALMGTLAAALGLIFMLGRMREKSLSVAPGSEVMFTERQASLIERLLRNLK